MKHERQFLNGYFLNENFFPIRISDDILVSDTIPYHQTTAYKIGHRQLFNIEEERVQRFKTRSQSTHQIAKNLQRIQFDVLHNDDQQTGLKVYRPKVYHKILGPPVLQILPGTYNLRDVTNITVHSTHTTIYGYHLRTINGEYLVAPSLSSKTRRFMIIKMTDWVDYCESIDSILPFWGVWPTSKLYQQSSLGNPFVLTQPVSPHVQPNQEVHRDRIPETHARPNQDIYRDRIPQSHKLPNEVHTDHKVDDQVDPYFAYNKDQKRMGHTPIIIIVIVIILLLLVVWQTRR